MNLRAIFALLLVPMFCGACASTPPSVRIERMYEELRKDVGERKLGASSDIDWRERQAKRVARVHDMIDKGELSTGADFFHASVILVETDNEPDLLAALGTALHATELQEDRGFRVAAEATDKVRVKRGVPQKYGTQYMYEPVLKAWRLYPVDPATSDVERKAFGVEPLAELKAKEAVLNKITGGKPN